MGESGIESLLFQKKSPIVTSRVMAFREIPFAIKSDLFSLAHCEAAEVGDPCQTRETIPSVDGALSTVAIKAGILGFAGKASFLRLGGSSPAGAMCKQ